VTGRGFLLVMLTVIILASISSIGNFMKTQVPTVLQGGIVSR